MKALRYWLTSAAHEDILRITCGVASFSPRAADHFADELEQAFELLRDRPFLGRARDELRPGLRGFVISRYVIFYEFVREEVIVLRVIEGWRDIPHIIQT